MFTWSIHVICCCFGMYRHRKTFWTVHFQKMKYIIDKKCKLNLIKSCSRWLQRIQKKWEFRTILLKNIENAQKQKPWNMIRILDWKEGLFPFEWTLNHPGPKRRYNQLVHAKCFQEQISVRLEFSNIHSTILLWVCGNLDLWVQRRERKKKRKAPK